MKKFIKLCSLFLLFIFIFSVIFPSFLNTSHAIVEEYNKKSALYSFALGAVLVAHSTLFTFLLIIFVLEFLAICELAFKIHQFKTKPIVKKEKKISLPYEIYTYEGQTEMPSSKGTKDLEENVLETENQASVETKVEA